MLINVFERSADAIDSIFTLHFPDARKIIDVTVGSRIFYRGERRGIIGGDLRKEVDPDYIGDARRLPMKESSSDLVIFDPPFKVVHREYDKRYGQSELRFNTETKIRRLNYAVLPELFRVSRCGVIIKTCDGTDGHRTYNHHIDIANRVRELTSLDLFDYAIIARRGVRNNLVPGKIQRYFRRPISYFLIWKYEKIDRSYKPIRF